MLNHSAEPNCEITFDDYGNCEVTTMYNIQPGTPLTISYGDPTNPTPVSVHLLLGDERERVHFVRVCVPSALFIWPKLSSACLSLFQIFAQYGFLPADCTTLFCKAMHLEPYIKELGIEFKDLLIQVESGEIAPKVRYWLWRLMIVFEQYCFFSITNYWMASKSLSCPGLGSLLVRNLGQQRPRSRRGILRRSKVWRRGHKAAIPGPVLPIHTWCNQNTCIRYFGRCG